MKIELEIESKSLAWRLLKDYLNYFNIKYERVAKDVESSEKKINRESKKQ